MDKIIITGLHVETLIGVYDWERIKPQQLVLDVELCLNLRVAADSDDVKDTADYAKVAALLQTVATQSQYRLLEALAHSMIVAVMQQYAVDQISLSISKPNILPDADKVCISMHRTRAQMLDKLAQG